MPTFQHIFHELTHTRLVAEVGEKNLITTNKSNVSTDSRQERSADNYFRTAFYFHNFFDKNCHIVMPVGFALRLQAAFALVMSVYLIIYKYIHMYEIVLYWRFGYKQGYYVVV